MVVIYGTLGFHPEKLLGGISAVGRPVERMVVYTAYEDELSMKKVSKAVEEVRVTAEKLGIDFEHREFPSPWDFFSILKGLLTDLKRERKEVVLNLTGGPKTMTVASTIVSIFLGLRVIYIPEESNVDEPPIELPLFRVPYSGVLSKGQLRVLRCIEETEPWSLDQLSRALRLSNATISYHIHNLERMGAVEIHIDGSDRTVHRPRVTMNGKMMLLAEESLGEHGSRPHRR